MLIVLFRRNRLYIYVVRMLCIDDRTSHSDARWSIANVTRIRLCHLFRTLNSMLLSGIYMIKIQFIYSLFRAVCTFIICLFTTRCIGMWWLLPYYNLLPYRLYTVSRRIQIHSRDIHRSYFVGVDNLCKDVCKMLRLPIGGNRSSIVLRIFGPTGIFIRHAWTWLCPSIIAVHDRHSLKLRLSFADSSRLRYFTQSRWIGIESKTGRFDTMASIGITTTDANSNVRLLGILSQGNVFDHSLTFIVVLESRSWQFHIDGMEWYANADRWRIDDDNRSTANVDRIWWW